MDVKKGNLIASYFLQKAILNEGNVALIALSIIARIIIYNICILKYPQINNNTHKLKLYFLFKREFTVKKLG